MKNAPFYLALWVSVLPALDAATEVRESITTDTVWSAGGSPYLVYGQIGVAPGVTLTIEPGVVVKFATREYGGEAALWVRGQLRAVGTAEAPIYFTSLNDRSVGGRTGSGNPAGGDWGGIDLSPPLGDPASVLEHCVVRYAQTGVICSRAVHVLRRCRISQCGRGVVISERDTLAIEHCQISQCQTGVELGERGTLAIVNCQLEESGAAVRLGRSARVRLEQSTIRGCGDALVWDGDATVEGGGNTVTNNSNNGVRIGGTIDWDTVWSRERLMGVGLGARYVVGPGLVAVAEMTTLTIEPGVVVEFTPWEVRSEGGGLQVRGQLRAVGTAGAPIYFIPLNNQTGYWQGIFLEPPLGEPASVLEHCVVRYAQTGVTCSRAAHVLRHCRISLCQTGVYASRCNMDISGCSFRELGSGVVNETPEQVVVARFNYWGDPSGPLDDSDDRARGGWYNPNGKGVRVSDGVDYSNWLLEAPQYRPADLVVRDVLARQMPGTTLVEVNYEWSSSVHPYAAVSVAFSRDGGVNFDILPAADALSGEVGAGVAPGRRRFTWDAGKTLAPGTYGSSFVARLTVVNAYGTATAVSGRFALDLRLGTVHGLVKALDAAGRELGPLAGATVLLEPLGKRVATGLDGRFQIGGVPLKAGYLLLVSAEGYGTEMVSGVNLVGGYHLDVGTVRLRPRGGPLQLSELSPPVNPDTTEVPVGGRGYRYYRLLTRSGQPATGVRVVVRQRWGDEVPQWNLDGDTPHDWAGLVAGQADLDGLVRIGIPAEAVGTQPGTLRQFEVLVQGEVATRFWARLVQPEWSRVWRHRAGFEGSGKIMKHRGRGAVAFESEIRHEMEGGQVGQELISRIRHAQGGVEDSLSVGVNLLGFKVGGKLKEVYFYAASELYQQFGFDDTLHSGGVENLLKLHLALGDLLLVAPGMANGLYWHVYNHVEPLFLGTHLRTAGGRLILGGEKTLADANLKLPWGRTWKLLPTAELSGAVSASFGIEEQHKVEEPELGVERDYYLVKLGFGGEINLEFGLNWLPERKPRVGNVAVTEVSLLDLLNAGRMGSFEVALVLDRQTLQPKRVLLETSAEGVDEFSPLLLGWLQHLPRESGRERYNASRFRETVSFDLPEAGLWNRLKVLAPVWALLEDPGRGGVLRLDQPAALVGGLLAAALNEGRTLKYEKTIHLADVFDVTPGLGLDVLKGGLEVELEGEMEKGAEWPVESGKIWRNKRLVLQSGPKPDPNLIPQESALDLEGRWVQNAAGAIAEALGRVATRVLETGQTLVAAGSEAAKGMLSVSVGALAAGTEVVAMHFLPGGPGAFRVALHGPGGEDGYLPPAGAGNYRYGVSGFFRFHATNTLAGPARLTLEYQDADVVGLDESQLKVFWLEDGTNQWQLIGGTVDAGANRVTTEVTRWGTFALAPPLPTGQLQLRPSSDRLTADGQSTVTFVASNLVLNTGAPLNGPWLFTVEVSGGTVLEADLRPETPGTQLAATNAALRFTVRAPNGGRTANLRVNSLAGDAFGEYTLPLEDAIPPAPVSGLAAQAGQSRIWLTWNPSPASDLAAYRVYYRSGQPGPPWDGSAAVEGQDSPVITTATNLILAGLAAGTNYSVAVTAVDEAGNESAPVVMTDLTTREEPPAPPTGVLLSLDTNGVATVSWTLSEDDGFNDRDVTGYEIWRSLQAGGNFEKVREVGPRTELFQETPPPAGLNGFLRYGVRAVDRAGLASEMAFSARVLGDGEGLDTDGDGVPDGWEREHGFNPDLATDAAADEDGDGMSNWAEYRAGTDPRDPQSYLWIKSLALDQNDRAVELRWGSVPGRRYTVLRSATLPGGFEPLAERVPATPPENIWVDRGATNSANLFYRIKVE